MADTGSRAAEDDETDVESAVTRVDAAEDELTTEQLRQQVEEQYDFDDFGPEDMAQMSYEEWEVAFDPETWITGERLLDRVEADLKARVASRDVFARVERLTEPDRVVAYSEKGYAVVYENGSVEGDGTIVRDVQPTVALCSMEEYEVPDMPDGDLLPDPVDVPEGSGEFGNLMIQLVAGAQVLAGLALVGAALFADLGVISGVAGLGFLTIGILLFVTVANARLSDKFRAEEYRNRLRAVGLEDGDRPEFLPPSATEEGNEAVPDEASEGAEDSGDDPAV